MSAESKDVPSAARKRRPIEDDFGLDLPDSVDDAPADPKRRDTLDTADDNWDPDDDSDLGLGVSDDSEDVGLDTATGLEEGSESDFDVDDMGEGERWTSDSEDPDEPPEDDDELSSGAEDGWTGDDDTPIEDESFDPDLADEAQATPDDGGIEGLDDDTDLDEFDVTKLPKLETDSDDDADGLTIEALDELGEVATGDESSVELIPGQVWKQLPARSVRRSVLWSQAAGSSAAGAPKVVSLEHEGRVLLALSSSSGVALSREAGRFEELTQQRMATDVALTSADQGPQLFIVNDAGQLEHSADLGQSFAPIRVEAGEPTHPAQVLRVAGDGARQLAVLLAVPATTGTPSVCVARSTDGARRFVLGAPLAIAPSDVIDFSACRDALLLSTPTRVACSVGGAELSEPVPGARGPATLVDEEGEVLCYVCVPQATRTLIVRRALRSVHDKPIVLAELDADFGAPRSLAVSYSEGLVTLYVTNERALHRIEASLDGEELA